jgi:hypothetical protein
MSDMNSVIQPKSDQLNADDLIGGPRTITITRVELTPGTEQPVSVFFEGDGGKPYKSCKSMSRVMVYVWGNESRAYAGRSMTIYRDPDVTWGGLAVGGIRISHMSGITEPIVMALTATKKARKPYRVLPLVIEQKAPEPPTEPDKATTVANALTARFAAVVTAQDYYSILDDEKTAPQMQWLKDKRPALFADVDASRAAAADRMDEAPAAVAADGEMPG